jgi:uncharacterized protein (DUF697 family)
MVLFNHAYQLRPFQSKLCKLVHDWLNRPTTRDRQMAQDAPGSVTAHTQATPDGGVGSGSTEAKPDDRTQRAAKLVDRFSLWSGAAGLIPVPLLDIAAVGGVQLQMLRRLSEMYGVPFSENLGKSVIASVAGAVIPASTATTTAMGVGSMIKSVPGGQMVGALTMPLFSAAATYVIGKVFIQHFASGGTLLDFNPPDYREFIKTQREKFFSRSKTAPQPAAPQPPNSGTPSEGATTSNV